MNTICELARKNPGNYLGMAPTFFKLLTSIQNNWTLIKIVKLFGSLTPLEPRLAKKLVDPLTNIINTTPAKVRLLCAPPYHPSHSALHVPSLPPVPRPLLLPNSQPLSNTPQCL